MNILDLVREKTAVKKVSTTKGGEWAGACPSCGGKDRFRVWPDDRKGKGSFWCRQCGKTGDDVQFLVDFCGMAYREAFKAQGRETTGGGYVPERYRAAHHGGNGYHTPEFSPRHHDDPVETWQKKAGELVAAAHAALLENEKVLGWLDARGLDLHAVKMFHLGWFPGEKGKPMKFRPRVSWGLNEIIKENGRAKMLMIPRGIVIPWIHEGRVMRIKIRRPKVDLKTDRDVKYYLIPGSSSEPALYNADRRAFVIVESDLDGMLVARWAGTVAGCAALGSASNKPGTKSFYALKKSMRILNALDCDQAGVAAGKWWSENFEQTVRWPVPVGKDPGEAYQAGVDVLEWVSNGLPPALTRDVAPLVADNTDMKSVMAAAPADAPLPDEEPPAAIPAATRRAVQKQTSRPAELRTPGGRNLEEPPNLWPEESEKAPAALVKLSPALEELHRLLERYPVQVICTELRTAVTHAHGWNNKGVEDRVAQLVFTDPHVFDFLEAHPATTIHRHNFMNGIQRRPPAA